MMRCGSVLDTGIDFLMSLSRLCQGVSSTLSRLRFSGGYSDATERLSSRDGLVKHVLLCAR